MNSALRHSLPRSLALVLYLLLVYALVGRMDCESEQRQLQQAPQRPTCQVQDGDSSDCLTAQPC